MSDFVRGVVGVLAVGMIAGVGALMLIPQPSASNTIRFAEPAAKPCSQQVWPAADRTCETWTAPQKQEAKGSATPAAEAQAATAQGARAASAGQPPGREKPRTTAATAAKPTQNARAAQQRKNEGLDAVRRFGDDLSDVGASAYAPDRRAAPRRDANSHGTRAQGAATTGSPFFPLFR
jgi:hypothetical protein